MHEGALREVMAELGIDVIALNGSGWLVCQCPFAPLGFHKNSIDHEPSFFVKPNSAGVSGFNCFTCKQHGKVSALVSQLEHYSGESYGNLSTRVNLKELQNDFGTFGEVPEEDMPPEVLAEGLYSGVYQLAWESERAMEYLAGRGVDKMAAMEMGLLYDDDGYRVLFPVRNYQGGLWGFSGRSVIPDKERRNAKVKDYAGLKKSWVVLGEHLVAKSDTECKAAGLPRKPLLIVEGLFAYAHMVALGVREHANPIAPLGSRITTYQRDRIVGMNRPTYYLFDDDLAGDVGLYGKQNKDTGEHEGGGALDMTKEHVPTLLCYYPNRFAEGEGDPDSLTLDDVVWMLREGNEFQS